MEIPLKRKVFAWYFHRGVILTKDNLVKRNWHRSKKVCQCDETIKHLFFRCKFARSICSAIQIGSTLFSPRSFTNISSNWLNGAFPRFKLLIRVEAIALFGRFGYVEMIRCLMIKKSSLMRVVIYRCTTFLRSWSSLQHMENRDLFTEVSTRLKGTTSQQPTYYPTCVAT
jgi:hypothetical protein